MLVYGDQEWTGPTAEALARLHRQAEALKAAPRGILWHQACVAMFIAAAGVLQGVADAEFAALGSDSLSEAHTALMAALQDGARAIDSSWSSGFVDQVVPDLAAFETATLPAELTIRRCEG